MSKFDETVKELKNDIKVLEKEFAKKTKGLDKTTEEKAHQFVEKTESVINSSIEKISAVINDLKDDEDLNALLDKIKAKAKEAIDYALEKVDAIINGETDTDLDKVHDEIMNEYNKLKDTEAFKATTVFVKEGYAKINEFFEKPEVKKQINKAKKTTINLAEKGVAGLKKVLVVDEEQEPKKTKTTKKATKTTAKKTTKPATKKTTAKKTSTKKTTKTNTKKKTA